MGAAKSIHDLPPLETGGSVARRGFHLQDHVAVGFCLEMLAAPELTEVWCENQDDITLLWNGQGSAAVEFVQVKGDELDQLWSIAELCKRERKKQQGSDDGDSRAVVGTSIFERSLAYDRCSEPRRFRIVTARPVKDELSILKYDLNSVYRKKSQGALDKLKSELRKRVGSFKSDNGNDSDFWVNRTTWEPVHSIDAAKAKNMLTLRQLVEGRGDFLAGDHYEDIYSQLLTKVQDAALADWRLHPEKKKLDRSRLLSWFGQTVAEAAHPATAGTGKTLSKKMKRARIPSDAIETAISLRQHYRRAALQPRYADHGVLDVQGEVEAVLQALRAELDADVEDDSGRGFHARCLQRLEELHSNWPQSSRPPLRILQGCMYDITDRCPHRFQRATS